MQTFKKEERLSKINVINKLFSEGEKFTIKPYRVFWLDMEMECNYPAQVLISVSKKHFKRAVDRNLIKRRTREAYRKNKADFYSSLNKNARNCVFALLYNSGEIASYKDIEEKIILILQRLQSVHENNIE
ncbi:MAG: ribonuclease P protein component [Bacteroidales bacterium]|nr:ribonuclease P protein component [Bacteroidales bacterium]